MSTKTKQPWELFTKPQLESLISRYEVLHPSKYRSREAMWTVLTQNFADHDTLMYYANRPTAAVKKPSSQARRSPSPAKPRPSGVSAHAAPSPVPPHLTSLHKSTGTAGSRSSALAGVRGAQKSVLSTVAGGSRKPAATLSFTPI